MLWAVVYWLNFNNSFQNKQKPKLQRSLISSGHQPEMPLNTATPLNTAARRASQSVSQHCVLLVHMDTEGVANLENIDVGKIVKYF